MGFVGLCVMRVLARLSGWKEKVVGVEAWAPRTKPATVLFSTGRLSSDNACLISCVFQMFTLVPTPSLVEWCFRVHIISTSRSRSEDFS